MKVLFVHGFEAGVNGNKPRYLKSHFDVCVPFIEKPFNLIASILLIAENIREFKPDVVIGSSYGGFIALLLMQLGEWKGPSILLAQATGIIFSNRLWLPKNSVCTIVHGTRDQTVDVEGSRVLFSSGSPELVQYIENDERHGLSFLNSGTTFKDLVEGVYSSMQDTHNSEKPKLSTTPMWWLRIKLILFVVYNLFRNIPTIIKTIVFIYKKKDRAKKN